MISLIKKIKTRIKYSNVAALLTVCLLSVAQSALADGPPAKSSMTNPLVIVMVAFMIGLFIIIAVLGSMLISSAKLKFKKWKDESSGTIAKAATIATVLFFTCGTLMAQTAGTTAPAASDVTAGISSTTFYIMAAVIFFELIIILALLLNVRGMLRTEKERVFSAQPQQAVAKKPTLNWWDKFNKFRPVEQEADIDLGHNYDGIRELDNRLPPWWLWGFYVTIIFAAVYLYRYHVSHSAPLSVEEYNMAVAKGDEDVKAYLKLKGETIDENSVTMLGKDDIEEGHKLFQTSCIACHLEGGAGSIGPNLTDDYWLHGGDIKSVFKTIKYGVNAMPTWQNTYSNKQIAELASYVKSLHGTHPVNPKSPQGDLYKESATTDTTAAKTDSASVTKDTSTKK